MSFISFFKKLDRKQRINFIAYLFGIGVLLFLFIFLVTSAWIGFGVRDRCNQAQQRYEGDCVIALMQLVEDEQAGFADRNSSVWALGQLGDDRALPLLERLYQGSVPVHREKWNEMLSQYELSKAVKLLNGGWNISAVAWR